MIHVPPSVRAELVEALPFFCSRVEEGKQPPSTPPAASLRTGFDKLRANGNFGSGVRA